MRPSDFDSKIWWHVLRRVWTESDRRNLGLVSAGVAFYALLSIFPALAALIAIWGFVADPSMIQDQLGLAAQLLPEDVFMILQQQVTTLVSANNSTLQLTSLVSLLLALWTAKNSVGAIIRGLNSIYREKHRANPLKRYGTAIVLTLVLLAIAMVSIASVVILPSVLAFLRLPVLAELAITVAQWLILLAVVFFGIAVLYRYGPNRRGARTPWVTPGALAAMFFWTAGSLALSIYLRNFGNYNEVYGSLGAVVALLFWFYISAYVILLGALLNAELELATATDTTIGAERPPGAREAFVADYIIDSNGETRLADDIPRRYQLR
nr:YihY/virulence factor BrkB family protein [Aquicoccus sp. G2-2]MEA1115241.1 YihY/virulence factor BrkB family protein [Aquicoccus sp. G2-2]